MSQTLKPEDQAFFDLVTRFLNEANAMNDREHRSRISAAILPIALNARSNLAVTPREPKPAISAVKTCPVAVALSPVAVPTAPNACMIHTAA